MFSTFQFLSVKNSIHYKVNIFCFWNMVLVSDYRIIERFLRIGLVYGIFSSLSIKSLLYFLKIMCYLDRKYNRKMCVFDIRLPLYTFHSLLHYKVDIFSFLTVVLAMYSSTPERFLKIRRLVLVFSPIH